MVFEAGECCLLLFGGYGCTLVVLRFVVCCWCFSLEFWGGVGLLICAGLRVCDFVFFSFACGCCLVLLFTLWLVWLVVVCVSDVYDLLVLLRLGLWLRLVVWFALVVLLICWFVFVGFAVISLWFSWLVWFCVFLVLVIWFGL